MSILLTHAYYLFEDAKEQKIIKPYPPLGLLYISSFLNKHNVLNNVFDSTFYSFEAQLRFILEKQPRIVAIYTNLMTKINVIKLIKILKKESVYGFPKIILGGPDITFNCENYLKTGADFLVIGEGEQTTLELYNAIINNRSHKDISGIAFIENEKVIMTDPREKMKDLSKLPIPNRDIIPIHKYLETWRKYHGKSSMTVSTQRGCPYTCKWCSTAVYGLSYRRRPAKLVVEELMLLKETYNPDAIWFVDDVFTVSHKWINDFYREMKSIKLKIPFEIITRAERLNDAILNQLKEIGCFRIWIGAESGSQKVIDAMDRRVEINVVKEAIQKTNQIGIETGTFIMLGYPGETENDINETIQYLKEANPTHYTITVAYPIKGTSLYNEIEDKITAQPNWETSTDREIGFKRTYNRKYYDYAVSKIVNSIGSYKSKSRYSISCLIYKLKIYRASIMMNLTRVFLIFCILIFTSCTTNSYSDLVPLDSTINLKWNKAYPEDTIEKSILGLQWSLSYLGATIPDFNSNIIINNKTIKINLELLGFAQNTKQVIQDLHDIIMESEEYQINNSIDLGRYTTLLLGSSEHYYKIVDLPENLETLIERYDLTSDSGYVNNSNVSLVHRVIRFSEQNGLNQLFISKEIDPLTAEVLEIETLDLLPNGQTRFGIYDKNGMRKIGASTNYTNAGKPGKCMWCHESKISPLFMPQNDYQDYLSYNDLQSVLTGYSDLHNEKKNNLPQGVDYSQTQEHTLAELLYISFLEPSAERLAIEWNLPVNEIQNRLDGLDTHTHDEFPFLGELYNRNDIEEFAPYQSLQTSKSVRELSEIEINYLN